MTVPVLLTKVTLPHRRRDLLTRQRLVEIVEESLDRKLTFVVAPAGYGKTSLLIDVAHRHEFPFCWYSQEQTDNDLSSFLAHFIACIEQRFPRFGEQSRAALFPQGHCNLPPENCVTVIVNELYNTITEHFVIVLDDFHLVCDHPEINEFINGFVQDVDQNCHVVILSRILLTFPDLPLMVARTQTGGLGLKELAFRPDEIKTLMLQNYRQAISDEAAQELAQKTDGWITGLVLSAQTMWRGMLQHLESTSREQLYEYLANQVLDQQPSELRNFLLKTAFLEEFNAELCQELLGPPPADDAWQAMMETILTQNLFVLALEKDGFWLRYHHLFRDFLQDRLRQDDPRLAYQLQQSLIDIYARREQWQKAYAICCNLGDLKITGDFLERSGEPMVRSGQVALLKSWLEALPASFIAERPALLARLGIGLAMQGDTRQGLRLLNQAVERFVEQHDQKRLAGVLTWRALVHFLQTKSEDSITDAQEVLRLTQEVAGDEATTRFRAEAFRILGQNSRLQGSLQQSIDYLAQSQKLFQAQHDDRGFNLVQMCLGATYGDMGEFSSARACYQHAHEYYRTEGDPFSEAGVLNDLAVLHHISGEYPQAFATFEQALEAARRGSNTRVETMVLVGLGDLLLDLDAPENALDAYRQARDRVERSKDHFLSIYIHVAKASANRLLKDFSGARGLLQVAEQLMGPSPANYPQGLWLLESGQLALAENHISEGKEQLAQAAFLFESNNQRLLAGRANLLLAGALFALEEAGDAEKCLEKAFQIVSDLDSQHVLVCVARQVKPLLASPALSPATGRRARRLLEGAKQFEGNLLPLRRSLRFREMEIPLSPPSLSIQALGATRVLLDGRPLTSADWQAQTTRDLFFLFLGETGNRSKEILGEIVWPDCTPAQLSSRFKNAVYLLRRTIHRDVILFDGERYTFNRELDYSYDVERFEQLISQAKEEKDFQARKRILEEAYQLYQGDYLPEIGGAWVMPEREHLRQAFLAAGLQLAAIYLDTHQIEQTLEICKRLISVDACLENAYCLAMQALAVVNDRPGVIRLYEKLRANLEDKYGIAPSVQTSTLFGALVH